MQFSIFFPIVFLLYWYFFSQNVKKQNKFLLVVSFFFFACFDWKFLFLLLFSIVLDFSIAFKIFDSRYSIAGKKFWLYTSICINVCFLSIFKYYNFFVENAAAFFGIQTTSWALNIFLPVGISFYTFHGLSYVIDVYRGRIKPVESFIYYSLFVSFFPLLVAGPIERATHLLPQIKQKRNFDYAKTVDGLRQVL